MTGSKRGQGEKKEEEEEAKKEEEEENEVEKAEEDKDGEVEEEERREPSSMDGSSAIHRRLRLLSLAVIPGVYRVYHAYTGRIGSEKTTDGVI